MHSRHQAGRQTTRRQLFVQVARGLSATALATGLPREAVEAQANPDATVNLAEVLEPIRTKYDLPALAACVLKGGKIAGLGATGVRKYGDKTPVTAGDQFHLGSCTKAMTSTLCGLLIEAGKLEWDTPLEKHFPELADTMAPAYRQLRLDHLFAQRTGFSSESAPQGMSLLEVHRLPGKPREQRVAYAKRILQDPPVSEPGTKFLYSNRNFAVAGMIAERAADLAWEELITQKLFQPLGMKSAGFGAMG